MTVAYFDGNNASQQICELRYDAHSFYLSVMNYEGVEQEMLSVHYADCSIQNTNNNLLIFLKKNPTQYVNIDLKNPVAALLKTKIESAQSSWFSKLIKIKSVFLIVFFFCLVGLMYWGFTQFVPWIGMKIISPKREIAIGEALYSSIISQEKIDSQKTTYINQFSKALNLSEVYPIKVTVVKSITINAFAMPGGHIVVYSGLLDEIKTSRELVALLSHESSHVNERHSLKSLLRSAATGLVFSIVLNDASGIVSVLVENADLLRSMQYSRSLEQQADENGMRLMVRNNINPIGMAELMKTLQSKATSMPNILEFLSSHPATSERIIFAKDFSRKYDSSTFKTNPNLEAIFAEVKKEAQ